MSNQSKKSFSEIFENLKSSEEHFDHKKIQNIVFHLEGERIDLNEIQPSLFVEKAISSSVVMSAPILEYIDEGEYRIISGLYLLGTLLNSDKTKVKRHNQPCLVYYTLGENSVDADFFRRLVRL